MSSLIGRRALITGSFQGIGLGIAKALASDGAQIILHGLADAETISRTEEEVRSAGAPYVESYTSDLRDSSSTEKLIEKILSTGNVDILCNNAGIQYTATIQEMPRAKWEDITAINLSSYFDTMRLLLPAMKERGYGRVINTASVHGLVASVAKAPYVAAKHGVIGLTRVAALEYADVGSRESGGVTVNAICPGWVETALIESQIQTKVDQHNGDRAAGIADLLSEKQPSRRMATPEDIGALALFLTSKAAHNITGAAIPVDGGWTAQ
jgi:3-hydroxybutyrate dehydrogenase